MDLSIDKEFSALTWQLTNEERILLDVSLKQEGYRDPIVYWENGEGNPVLDGHNRKSICDEHGIEYPIKGMQFPNREAAIDWMVRTQLGRRNATEVQKSCLRARLLDNAPEFDVKLRTNSDDSPEGESEPAVKSVGKPRTHPHTTVKSVADRIAQETGVSTATVFRDAAFSKKYDRLKERSPQLANVLATGKFRKRAVEMLSKAPDKALRALEQTPAPDLPAAIKAVCEAVPMPGQAKVDVRELGALEAAVGKVVRANTDALKKCGGKEHHETIRLHLVSIFDEIVLWKKDAEE